MNAKGNAANELVPVPIDANVNANTNTNAIELNKVCDIASQIGRNKDISAFRIHIRIPHVAYHMSHTRCKES